MKKSLNLSLMRNSGKVSILTVSVLSFYLFACQKDENSMDKPATGNTYSTVEYFVDDDEYWNIAESDMEDFLESMLDSTWEDTISFNQAMYLSEAFSNLSISSVDMYEDIRELQAIEFEFEIDVIANEEDRYVAGSVLKDFNRRLYQRCDSILDTLTFPSSGDGAIKFIQVMDFEWEVEHNEAPSQSIKITMLAAKDSPESITCSFSASWYAFMTGGCNGNSDPRHSTVMMESFLNNYSCNTSYGCSTGTGERYYFDVSKSGWIYPNQYPGDLWGPDPDINYCLSASEMDQYTTGAEDISLAQQPYISGSTSVLKGIIGYNLQETILLADQFNPAKYLHILEVTYANCNGFTLEGTPSRISYSD